MLFNVLFESLFIVIVVYILFYLLFYKTMKNLESCSSYECGFDPNSLTRSVFSYRFFLISILFLIFDVEISLMLPIPFLVGEVMGLIVFLIFIVVLILGLLYEYKYGSLDWLDNFVSKV